jgi:hypothetical protein
VRLSSPGPAISGWACRTIAGGKIVEIDALSDPARLRRLDLTVVEDGP